MNDIQREKIPANQQLGIPALVKETIDGTFIKEDLENYFKEDTSNLLFVLKQQNIWIAGGYILKNFLKDKPGFREEFWTDSDIDFWGVTDNDGIHEDPYCPLRKILKRRGYKSRIVATQSHLQLISADYKRLALFVNSIQEWTRYDLETGFIHKIQLILLKNYQDYFIDVKNVISNEYRFRANAGYDVSDFEIDEKVEEEIRKYKDRTEDDFLTDAILSFDLTCCQVAYQNGKVTWFGTTNSDDKKELVDYPEDTPIIQNVERYLTKIGSQAFKQQSVMEWLRTLKRSMKYAQRGFRIVNWKEVEAFILETFLSENEVYSLNNDFIRQWNNTIYGFRFYKYAQFIPIWLVDNDHKLYVFNLQNRKPVYQFINPSLTNNLNTVIINQIADKEVDEPLTKELLVDLTGTNNFLVDHFIGIFKGLRWFPEMHEDIPLSKIEYPFLKNQEFKDDEKLAIDESKLLEESQPECFDIIEAEDFNNRDFLERDEDNILVIRKEGDDYRIDCYRRQLLQDIIEDPTKGKYSCNMIQQDGTPIADSPMMVRNLVDQNNVYYRLDTSFGRIYLSKDDILKMIRSKNNIFYIEYDQPINFERSASVDVVENEIAMIQGDPFNQSYLIGADHCQQGTDIKVFRIKVCGGINCLKTALDEKTWLDVPL